MDFIESKEAVEVVLEEVVLEEVVLEEVVAQFWTFYPLGSQHVHNLVEGRRPQHIPVDQQGLHGVARSRVVALCISD